MKCPGSDSGLQSGRCFSYMSLAYICSHAALCLVCRAGKTFLGVKLLQVILHNTCNKQHVVQQSSQDSNIDPTTDLEAMVQRQDTLDQREGDCDQ